MSVLDRGQLGSELGWAQQVHREGTRHKAPGLSHCSREAESQRRLAGSREESRKSLESCSKQFSKEFCWGHRAFLEPLVSDTDPSSGQASCQLRVRGSIIHHRLPFACQSIPKLAA